MAASAGVVAYIGGYKNGWAYLILDSRGYHGKCGQIEDDVEINVHTCFLYAVFHLLEDHKGNVLIKTNSKYTVSCFTEWIEKWIDNGFKGSNGLKLTNAGIIQTVYHLMADRKVKFEYAISRKSDKYKVKVDEEAYNGCTGSQREFRGRINQM